MSISDEMPKLKEDIQIKEEIIYTDRSRDYQPTVEIFEIEQIKISEKNRKENRARGRNRKKPGRETEYSRQNADRDNEKYDGQNNRKSWKNSNRYMSSHSQQIHFRNMNSRICWLLPIFVLGFVVDW